MSKQQSFKHLVFVFDQPLPGELEKFYKVCNRHSKLVMLSFGSRANLGSVPVSGTQK